MIFNQIIALKGLVDDGTSLFRSIFAARKSIPQNEFFSAAQADIQPSTCFVVRTVDYDGEEYVKYNNKIYHIYRVYNVKNELTELYCEVRIGDGKYND